MTKETDPNVTENSDQQQRSESPAVHDHQTDGNASFLRAARAGNLDRVLEYLKGSIDINTSNANGLNALHLASKEGHVNVVTELLKRGANVDAATKKGNTALHIASLAGREEIVKILVQREASVNVQSQNGFTPLYMAAQENHDLVVKFLLSNGANQSLATEDGFTPLAVALQQGHDKVVAVLLENDTRGKVRLPALHIAAKKDDCKAAALLLQNDHNPDVTSKSGFTPLHIAAHYGNENIANLLLQRGADVNFAAKHNITPMHVASKWGKSNMVTLLIDKQASIDAKTKDGLTPLHCAARSGHDQVVELLLDKGAPIVAKTKNGLAPLHMAAQGDHVDSARILLYNKAPVDDVTIDYLTALHVAAHCGHVRVAKLLLDRKADPNARALNGFTPLHIACKKNRIKVVELLLKHGASIEATTESGLTPLHVASFMGCMNIVIYLIQHGSNPDVPTVRGETPLHLAARANQTDIIRILLRNGAHVDARAREQQTPLHIAARLGNSDIVALLLQHGATVDSTTKDMYTALHIAAKEGQEEVTSVLLEHGAMLTATTKKGFTPLHLAAKYGNMKVARLLLQRDAPVDAQGKNGVTPLHVAAHYDNQNVALLLLDKGASPHATAKNGYTPLHIAAKKNQMDIATTLLEYGAKSNAESKAGFTPLHLAAQEGHTDMSTLLLEHHADVNCKAKNGLTPLHLCAQEDKVNVAAILVKSGAEIDSKTKAGYTPLHVACHFGQMNMVRFLLQHGADVNATTAVGYTPLHQASQQGHTQIVNLLLENRASPNAVTNQGQTALSIAQRLGYISVVEELKIVTETTVTTTVTTITEEKYRVVAPETMQETFMSDSEDEGGEDTMLGDQSYRYLTVDEMKSLGDDSLPIIDPTRDERMDTMHMVKESLLSAAPPAADDDQFSPQPPLGYAQFTGNYAPDNIDISRSPIHAGPKLTKFDRFLVSFMVDARGGAMRGCRHSGVRVIIPPRKAPSPMRITCRYLKKEKLTHPPPLMDGEACASRILEVGPTGAKFLGPVIIEVPHFASLRGKEREITILRSDDGETWREHTLEASEEAVQEVLNESFDGEELSALEDLNTNRITRILTTDFPQYFAIITRVRQEVHAIGPEGGMVSSTVVPQVQAVFPEGALTKKIKVGLQAQPIPAELVAKMLGNRVAVSPVVTVEPRRRKFHKPITLTIPVPQAAARGMINQYSGETPTLRLLCSITGGTVRAQWEDVTGSTPLTFVNDCVSFTTTVSARFWLMDCRNISEATKMATELYRDAIHVPFMAKFVVFAKRHDPVEAKLRVFCMTDDKEDKTLENQEHFTEVAKSRDVEVLENKPQYVEFAGNLIPVTKSGEQLALNFHAFRENRLPFTVREKDPNQEPIGRIAFMREPKVGRSDPPQTPICNLNITLPDISKPDSSPTGQDVLTVEKKYVYLKEMGLSKPETIHKADLRLSDIAALLGNDWVVLALQLDVPESDINLIKTEYPDDINQQAIVMLRLWMQLAGNKATGNTLEKALRKINREDIVNQCIFNVELVTDDVERAVAKVHLDQSGFDTLKEELGPSREASLRRDISLDVSYDEKDIMKEAESAEETSSETGSIAEHKTARPDLIDTGEDHDPARLAESEMWTSQELDRSTPDVMEKLPSDDKMQKTVEEKEWTETMPSGTQVTRKEKIIKYSTDAKDSKDFEDLNQTEPEKEATSASTGATESKEEMEVAIVEETVPFAQKKDFFQKLVDDNSEKQVDKKTIDAKKGTQEISPPPQPAHGEVIEDMAPFAERVEFFRRSLEESSLLKDVREVAGLAHSKLKSPVTSPPKSIPEKPLSSPTRTDTTHYLPSTLPPHTDEKKASTPIPPPRKGKQLSLKSPSPQQETLEELSPFTPDLETPKETPEMASKSDEQKMVMVTERVADAATSLACSLEKADRTSSRKPIEEVEEEVNLMFTKIQEVDDDDIPPPLPPKDKWSEVESIITQSFQGTDVVDKNIKDEETKKIESDYKTSKEMEEGKAIKAEIKLMVKTIESGKEEVEIRSIREFVDSDAKSTAGEETKIFSGILSTNYENISDLMPPLDQTKELEEPNCPSTIPPSSVNQIEVKSPLSTHPCPIEPILPDAPEQKVHTVGYSHSSDHHQIQIAESPSELLLTSSLVSAQESSDRDTDTETVLTEATVVSAIPPSTSSECEDGSDQEVSAVKSDLPDKAVSVIENEMQLAFENRAFAGVDKIDEGEENKQDTSPFEVPRDDSNGQIKRYQEEEIKQETLFKREIFSCQISESLEKSSPEVKLIPRRDSDETCHRDRPFIDKSPVTEGDPLVTHIRKEIIETVLDETIDNLSLEEKEIPTESKHHFIEKDTESDVVESAFPKLSGNEQKDLPILFPHEFNAEDEKEFSQDILQLETIDAQKNVHTALHQTHDQMIWETPVQEEMQQSTSETAQEIPSLLKTVAGKDEDSTHSLLITEKMEHSGVLEECLEKSRQSIDQIIVSETISKTEVISDCSLAEVLADSKCTLITRPPLEHISSEISEEDLVEKFGISPEKDFVPKIKMEERETKPYNAVISDEERGSVVVSEDVMFAEMPVKEDEIVACPQKSSISLIRESIETVERISKDDEKSDTSKEFKEKNETVIVTSCTVEKIKRSLSQTSLSDLEDKETSLMGFKDTASSKEEDGSSSDIDRNSQSKMSSKLDKPKSGLDGEQGSSSGDSPFLSFDVDSGQTSRGTHSAASRPCSSDVEALMGIAPSSSEYESCQTTSQEYRTARSSLSQSSRESMPSIDSESSGHLASFEASSETSETLMPSALEIEREMATPTADDERHFATSIICEEKLTSSAISGFLDNDVDDGENSPFEIVSESEMVDYEDQGASSSLNQFVNEESQWKTLSSDRKTSDTEDTTTTSTYHTASGSRETRQTVVSRTSIYRQESGAYMAGDKVDEWSPLHDHQFFQETAETSEILSKDTSAESTMYHHTNGPVEVEFVPEYDMEDDKQRAQDKIQSRKRCKEDTDDEMKEEDESGDPDKDKDLGGEMQESEVLFGEASVYDCSISAEEQTEEKDHSDDESSNQGEQKQAIASIPIPVESTRTLSSSIPKSVETEDDNFTSELECDRPESELRDLDLSRPQSHAESFYSRSDSEQRPYSELQFSDDRPDSELTGGLRHSLENERPLSPEPKDEYRIDCEAQVTQLEEDYGVANRMKYTEDTKVVSGEILPGITITQCPTPPKDKLNNLNDSKSRAETTQITPSTDGSDKTSENGSSSQEYILDKGITAENINNGSIFKSNVGVAVSEPIAMQRVTDKDWNLVAESPASQPSLISPDEDLSESSEKGQKESPESHPPGIHAHSWLADQFQTKNDSTDYQGDLYLREEGLSDILEEGEEDKVEREVCSSKESTRSTPEFDVFPGRKGISKSSDHDDISMNSLQEFERLEAEMNRRSSLGSQDSLNGRRANSGSGHGGDAASVSSLQEFETLESECEKAEESKDVQLSEIEEGHESQISESEGHETLSEQDPADDSDVDDYEKRLFEIDEIIRQAQTNVEKFESDNPKNEIVDKSKQDSGSGTSADATESSMLDRTPSPSEMVAADGDADSLEGEMEGLPASIDSLIRQQRFELDRITLAQHVLTTRTLSSESSPHHSRGHSSASTTTQYDVDSLRERECDLEEQADYDRDSLQGDDDAEGKKQIEIDLKEDLEAVGEEFDRDSLGKGRGDLMVSSTDSLEPSSSTATHATYHYETDSIMSSSFASVQTSGEESTMMSSTDTLDTDQHTTHRSITPQGETPQGMVQLDNLRNVDSQGNIPELTTQGTDVFGQTIKRTVMTEPEVRTITFSGPDAEQKMQDFIRNFQPGEDVIETEATDEEGNVHVMRTVQHRVVMQPQMTKVQFTGPDAEDQLQKFMNQTRHDFQQEEEEEESEINNGTIRRVIRRRIVQPDIKSMTFSGPDARKQMEEFMKQTLPNFEPTGNQKEFETKDDSGNETKVTRHSSSKPHDHRVVLSTQSSHSEDCYCGPDAPPHPNGIQHRGDPLVTGDPQVTRVTSRRQVRTVTTVDADGKEQTVTIETTEQDGDGEQMSDEMLTQFDDHQRSR